MPIPFGAEDLSLLQKCLAADCWVDLSQLEGQYRVTYWTGVNLSLCIARKGYHDVATAFNFSARPIRVPCNEAVKTQ